MKSLKNLSKRGIALLLSLMMLFSMVPVNALAEESPEPEQDAVTQEDIASDVQEVPEEFKDDSRWSWPQQSTTTPVYLYVVLPDKQAADTGSESYAYLSGGGAVKNASDTTEIRDSSVEETIRGKVSEWPTTLELTTSHTSGSKLVEKGPNDESPTWEITDKGEVTNLKFWFTVDGTQRCYSSTASESTDGASYGIRWVTYTHPDEFHVDGVLYKKTTTEPIIPVDPTPNPTVKDIMKYAHKVLPVNDLRDGSETFSFRMYNADVDGVEKTPSDFTPISLTARVTTESVKDAEGQNYYVGLSYSDSNQSASILMPQQYYAIEEQLEDTATWQTPNQILVYVEADGTIKWSDGIECVEEGGTRGITNTLKRYSVTYQWENAPTGATLPADATDLVNGDTYTVAEVQNITTDDATWTFSGWKNGETVVNGQQTIAGADVTLTGSWTKTVNQYTVTGTIDHGTVSDGGQKTVNHGDSVSMTFTPDTGYKITGVRVNGTAVENPTIASDGTYTYTNDSVISNITVAVTTEPDDSQTKELTYTVEYYKGGVKVGGDTQTETQTVQVLQPDTLTVEKSKINTTNKYNGYKLEKVVVGEVEQTDKRLPETVNNGAVIKVYYVVDEENMKTLSYTVEYYKDGEKVDADTQTETQTVQVLQPDTLTVEKSKINTTDKYNGYKLEKTEPATIPDTVNNGDVIRVYYKKLYTVTYALDGGSWPSDVTDPSGATYVSDETVTVATAQPTKTGYTFKEWTGATISKGGSIPNSV